MYSHLVDNISLGNQKNGLFPVKVVLYNNYIKYVLNV